MFLPLFFGRPFLIIIAMQDVIELRERKWIPRNQVAAPTTIAAVHEAVSWLQPFFLSRCLTIYDVGC